METEAISLINRIATVDEGRLRSRALGLGCYGLALALFVWAICAFVRAVRDTPSTDVAVVQARVHDIEEGFRFLLEFMVLPIMGIFIYLGKRLRAPSAVEILRRDSRLPVLYLRSFKFDGLASVGHLKLVSRSEEEDLVRCFRTIGPVIAIGDPREKIPEVGAARIHVNHEQWQQCALDIMAVSRLVLLRAGLTQGIFWEIDRLRTNVAPEKVLLFVPFIADRSRYADFCKGVGGPLGSKLSLLKDSRFVAFDKQWNPHGLGPPSGRIGKELESFIRSLSHRDDTISTGTKPVPK